MDETKSPGLIIEAILITESHFKRGDSVPPQLEYLSNVQAAYKLDDSKAKLGVLLAVRSKTTDESVEVSVSYLAVISKEPGAENMTFEEYFNSGAPQAMLYTYAREHLQTVTMKGAVPPLILGPQNVKPTNPVSLGV